ncbi:hypothetical protein N9L31_00140 [bacterium]|nr:hypothetical protein [bacterium]
MYARHLAGGKSKKVVQERQADLTKWLKAVTGVAMAVSELRECVLEWFEVRPDSAEAQLARKALQEYMKA